MGKAAKSCNRNKWRALSQVIKIEMPGAAGLEPATFGVTGRTKFNGINDSCKFFCG